MTNKQKLWLSNTLCIFLPILISLVCKILIYTQLEMVLTICYLILLFF